MDRTEPSGRPPTDDGVGLTRRALLQTAGTGAAAVAAAHAVPAWARPSRASTRALRQPDSLPFPSLPPGTPSMPEIEHIVVLIMENHSFDNLLGMLPNEVRRRSRVDGLTVRDGRLIDFNPDSAGNPVFAVHASSPCQLVGAPSQSWNASHRSFDGGRNDGFVAASGPVAMQFWDERDIPFTYSLARHFPIGQRYFSSVLAQTTPNRRFFFTGTASGTISSDLTTFSIPAANGTIWDRLDAYGIDWGIYFQFLPSWLLVPGSLTPARASRQRPFAQFLTDAAAGRLPQFAFIDPDYVTTSEENPQDIQVGEQFVAQVVNALISAPTWKSTALFLTFDEHGGYYDHVPPPPAIKPDSIAPLLKPGDAPGAYDRYGFRVPLITVSPWAKRHYVSSSTQDHTSLDAFIERKWNLPAMTFRDANAHPMTDYFDFGRPAFAEPPARADAPALGPGLEACRAAGLNPPVPPGAVPARKTGSDLARVLAHAQ